MCDKCNTTLEKYKILYTAYADEIRNLWTRSVFLGAFMTLAWGGYGALQLKILDNTNKISVGYHCASFGICLVIIVLSLLWIAMAKGSKFVQEAHEEHIKKLVEKDTDLQNLKGIYCDLRDYEYLGESENLFSFGVLTPFRYSPSKINIALGWISFVVSFMLLNTNLLMTNKTIKQFFHSFISYIQGECILLILIILYFLFVFLVIWFIKLAFKGKSNLGGEMARKDS